VRRRPTRGSRVALACDVNPINQLFESITMCPDIASEMQRSWSSGVKQSEQEFVGLTLQGKARREAPAQAELRPTCAGAYRSGHT
jgi:hypothetical protein